MYLADGEAMKTHLLWIALVMATAGCARDRTGNAASSEQSAPTPAATEAPEAAAAAGSAAPSRPDPRAFELVSPETVAARIQEGIAAFDGPTVESGLFELGRNLSVWRTNIPEPLAVALGEFAATGGHELRRRVDARFVPAVAEALLSLRDYAAVLRITTEYRDSAAEPSLSGPRALAEQEARRAPAQIVSIACPSTLDGHPVGEVVAFAAPGTYIMRCSLHGATVAIRAQPNQLTRVDWTNGVAVEQIPVTVATTEGSAAGGGYRLSATVSVGAPIVLEGSGPVTP